MKILIVDDEANIRRVVREYAEFEGYETDEAGDGMEAVSMAKTADYDVIVMDIMMPRLDGYSACKEIRKTKNTPIIMLLQEARSMTSCSALSSASTIMSSSRSPRRS